MRHLESYTFHLDSSIFRLDELTVQPVDMPVSWNFRHVVRLSRIRAFNAVNLTRGYPAFEIRSPLEFDYE